MAVRPAFVPRYSRRQPQEEPETNWAQLGALVGGLARKGMAPAITDDTADAPIVTLGGLKEQPVEAPAIVPTTPSYALERADTALPTITPTPAPNPMLGEAPEIPPRYTPDQLAGMAQDPRQLSELEWEWILTHFACTMTG